MLILNHLSGASLYQLLDKGMSSRVLARLAAKAHSAQQNSSGGSPAHPPESISQENPKKRSSTDNTTDSTDQQRNKRIQIEQPITRTLPPQTNPVRPLFGQPDNNDKEVLVRIEAGATWTTGLEHPMQALSVFDLPADAKNYENQRPVEIINRARRRFGRFAAEFVHLSNMFEKFETDESRQKLLEETISLRNERRQLQARVEELTKESKNFGAVKKTLVEDKAKLGRENQLLAQEKTSLSSKVKELENAIAEQKRTLLGKDQELEKVKKDLSASELEAERALQDGYVICFDRCKAAGKEMAGMSYKDYISELAEQLAQSTLNKETTITAQSGEGEIEQIAGTEQQVNTEEEKEKTGDAL